MAAYITRAEVHDGADRIDADGRKPSAKAIRDVLGRGSYTTIENHLATWVPRDQRLELPPMPDGLTATVSSLATDFWHIARNAAQAEAKTRVSEAASDVAEARSAAREAGEKADALASELDAARERTAELEEMVAERDRQIDAYVLHIRQLEVEDARKAGEIVSLQHTLTQFAPGADQMRSMHTVAVGQPAA